MAEEDQDDSQKTEDPTAKRLEESRRKGQVPLSREVNNWIMLFAATMVVVAFGPGLADHLTQLLRLIIEQSWQTHEAPLGLGTVMLRLMLDVGAIMGLPILVLLVASIIGPFAQIGPLVAFESIKPSLEKISPLAGMKRIFSMRALVEFIKGLIKITLISAICYWIFKPYFTTVDHLIGLSIPALMDEFIALFKKMMTAVLFALFLVAALDLLYQRLEHIKRLRMSRQDIKDEYKQTEGDPHMRARLRQLRMERSRKRMMQNVPKADVVITNPTHFAIALQYDPQTMDAPVCVAKGADLIAKRIREIANENKITIVENPPLARTLFETVEIDEAIPPEQYKAVAEVISYVFRLKKKLP